MANVFEALPSLLSELGLDVRHVLHVGAHLGEEVPYYRQAGIGRFTLVEPSPFAAGRLRKTYREATVIEAACGAEPGRGVLSVNVIRTSSTLAEPHPGDRILNSVPVQVRTVAELAPDDADMLVVDAQGLELDVLKGAGDRLAGFRVVVCETCTVPDPTMASPHDQVVDYMTRRGFTVAALWPRSYQEISWWVRGGPGASTPEDRVYDVVFVQEALCE
ncbi:FkbM family methyltransferase [Streptomyces sp. G1]|uniref:FkbM family methyltransferase n=1 Tax=Streptomyces sp. G1 TaxID=361572 RepID=UPI00203079D0|nr:FkbM family methyltransferase [Streptomyces sp. G1]MCM1972320.1 FkbM family methyltransferase [Streptomyces sp. G1]